MLINQAAEIQEGDAWVESRRGMKHKRTGCKSKALYVDVQLEVNAPNLLVRILHCTGMHHVGQSLSVNSISVEK